MQSTLEQRLEQLEKEVRIWRRVVKGGLLVAGVTLLMAAKPEPQVSEEIRARKFTLVDEKGQNRGTLGVMPKDNDIFSGATFLRLDNGNSHAMLAVMADQSQMRMARDDAQGSFLIKTGDKPSLMMIDAKRRRALTLGISDKAVLDISSLETGKPQPLWGVAH